MLKPVNNHLLIEPLRHDSFISSDKGTYEEIGVVIDADEPLLRDRKFLPSVGVVDSPPKIKKGDKVYFDSWLAAKYPKSETEFYWLVKWSDVRAVENGE